MSVQMQPKMDLTTTAIVEMGWKPAQLDVIKRSVAKEATLPELYQFLYLCKAYDLDPFKREIYFMKDDKGRPSIITGIDGFRKAAKRDQHYKGVQAFAVKEGDEFEIDPANYTVKHKFGAKRGSVIGAWARADADGKLPVIVWVDFAEFNKGTYTWKQMPAVMIAKVAESHAIRRQFGLAGLYTQEEMGVEKVPAASEVVPPVIDAEYHEMDAEPQTIPTEQADPTETPAEQSEQTNGTPADESIPADDDEGEPNSFFGKAWRGIGNLQNAALHDADGKLDRTVVHAIAGDLFGIQDCASLKQIAKFGAKEMNLLIIECSRYKKSA